MIVFRLRLTNLQWRHAWCIATCIWLLGSILITAYRFPTEEKLRAAWTAASYQTLIGDRETIEAADAQCRDLASASESLMCIDNVLWMKSAYRDKLDGLISYGEKRAQEERLPDQFFAVAEVLVLWAVPSFGLYLLGVGIPWAKKRAEKPAYQNAAQAGSAEVFRWPDRTRRKPRSDRLGSRPL